MTFTVAIASIVGAAALSYGLLKCLFYLSPVTVAVAVLGLVAVIWSWTARPDATGLFAGLTDLVNTLLHIALLGAGAWSGVKASQGRR